jgi:hypothetical protein
VVRCSFNNTELANRLVPVQPTELEARARAALLMDTIVARLRTSESSDGMAASSSPPVAIQVSGLALALSSAAVAPVAEYINCRSLQVTLASLLLGTG